MEFLYYFILYRVIPFVLMFVIILSTQTYLTFATLLPFTNLESFPATGITCANFITDSIPVNSLSYCAIKCLPSQRCTGFALGVISETKDAKFLCKMCFGDDTTTTGITLTGTGTLNADEKDELLWMQRTTLLENPLCPGYSDLPDGLKIGQVIQLKGVPTFDNDSFSLHFKYNTDNEQTALNIVAAFKHDFQRLKIGAKRKENNIWIVSDYVPIFPFKVGKQFEILVVVLASKYMIYVDGEFALDIDFGLFSPLLIRKFRCRGDVIISHIII